MSGVNARLGKNIEDDKQADNFPEERILTNCFQMKMSLEKSVVSEKGTVWQYYKKERQWCSQCRDKCAEGAEIVIKECDDDDDKQKWSYKNGKILSCDNKKLCITTSGSGSSLKLKTCTSKLDEKQEFTGFSSNKKFQIRPKDKKSQCISQNSHPKSNVKLKTIDCKVTEKNDRGTYYDDTSHWVIGTFKGH